MSQTTRKRTHAVQQILYGRRLLLCTCCRRALELLASGRDGCTEAMMLAHALRSSKWSSWSAPGLRVRQPSAWSPATRPWRSRGWESPTELEPLKRAFADLAATEFNGARDHLRKAAEELTAGRYPDSIRESINAVASVARTLEPDGSLSGALAKLEKSAKIHTAMKGGFTRLYGYTSDEQGIWHAHLNEPSAKPDETMRSSWSVHGRVRVVSDQ
jgi:hypothetical protein